MKSKADMSPDVLTALQDRERRKLEELTSPFKAAQIEMLLATRQWDALKPAFEAISRPRKRLQATAHACRIAAMPGTIMDAKLEAIASQSLWAYQRELTPRGERVAVLLCIGILRDNDRLAAPPIEKAIAESLLKRMGPNRTSDPMNMTRTMKAMTRSLLQDYFTERNGDLDDRPQLRQLMLHSRDADQAVTVPVRSNSHGTVTHVDFRRPR